MITLYKCVSCKRHQLILLINRKCIPHYSGKVTQFMRHRIRFNLALLIPSPQGVWAYNYWQLEKNIHAHAERVLKLIREIVEDEMKEYAEDLQGLYQNPITVWHPENGEVQAEFRLPMEVSRLDEVPDFTPLVNQISANMPDMKTLENISEVSLLNHLFNCMPGLAQLNLFNSNHYNSKSWLR